MYTSNRVIPLDPARLDRNGNAPARMLQPLVARVGEALCQQAGDLALNIARVITGEVRLHPSTAVPFDQVVADCAANLRAVLRAIVTGTEVDTGAASEVGLRRARDGVPLSSVMEAYRVGFFRLWDAVGAETARAQLNGEVLSALTARLLSAYGLLAAAMAVGYREEHTRQVLGDEEHRSAMIDALLHGRVFEQWSLWELADYLGLPSGGPFIVIAAEVTVVGDDALPGIESKMRCLDVFSAWRLLPDLQVGIVHVKTGNQLADVLRLLSRLATTRVGVSACYDDLRHTGEALRNARMMSHARPTNSGPSVAVFDGSILATAVVSAPEEMIQLAAPVLNRFADLGAEERDVLFETFQAWLDNGGSPTAAAEALCCHPNTVRYRLRRIEERTGRSLSRPRDVAELCLVFEAQRRLAQPDSSAFAEPRPRRP